MSRAGISPAPSAFWLLAFAGIAVAYTFLGGMWSVTITDVIQFVLMLGGALILLPMVMGRVGWWPELVQALPAEHLNLVPQFGQYNWQFILAIWILGIQWASTDQGLLQMSFSSKDPRSAARGLVMAGIITTPFAMLWILPGLAARVLHPGLEVMDQAFPMVMQSTLPIIVIGLVACGLLSSQMSTISTNLQGVATLFANDLYKTLLHRTASSRTMLMVVRIMTIVAGALGIGFAYLIPLIGENVVAAYLTVVGIFDMPFFMITIVFGLLWKRVNWQGALIGYLGGVVAGLIAYFMMRQDPNVFYYSTFFSTVVTVIVTPIATMLFPKQRDQDTEQIWRALKHDDTADGEAFHIVPISGPGKLFFGLFFLGLALFLAGVISASTGYAHAVLLTMVGMVTYFLAGLLRLYFD